MSPRPDATDGHRPPEEPATAETFERLLALSARALDALETGDLDAVQPIMTERDEIIASGVRAPTIGRNAQKRPTGELANLIERLQRSDARLALALAAKRDDLGRHLSALERRGAARSAYGPQRRPPASFNAVR